MSRGSCFPSNKGVQLKHPACFPYWRQWSMAKSKSRRSLLPHPQSGLEILPARHLHHPESATQLIGLIKFLMSFFNRTNFIRRYIPDRHEGADMASVFLLGEEGLGSPVKFRPKKTSTETDVQKGNCRNTVAAAF